MPRNATETITAADFRSGMKGRKYRNVPTTVDEVRFDSKLEARYYQKLKALQAAGEVDFFLRQVPIHLPGGVTMRVDFLVFYADGRVSFQDTKGTVTRDWDNKRKMAEALYPIEIEIVKRA